MHGRVSSHWDEIGTDEPFMPKKAPAWPAQLMLFVAALLVGVMLTAIARHFMEQEERRARIEQLLPEMRRADQELARERARADAEQRAALASPTLRDKSEGTSSSIVAALLLQNVQPDQVQAVSAPQRVTEPSAPAMARTRAQRKRRVARPVAVKAKQVAHEGGEQLEDPLFGL